MRKFGLIGYPLSHSFSQKYFSEKFIKENILDSVYENFSIPSIEELNNILENDPDLAGLNVTIPYKQTVINFLDKATTKLPIDACNCIRIQNKILTGYNTDIIGFEKSLISDLKPYHKNALILGNGGATKAVKYVLKKLQIDFSVVSRKINGEASLNYEDLSKEIIEKNLLIINATPLGMFPNIDDYPKIPYEYLSDKHYLYDLIYNPAETLFLKKAKAKGATIKNGHEMLIIQAEESWKIWNER
jgi:shikimate dehydrogenase